MPVISPAKSRFSSNESSGIVIMPVISINVVRAATRKT